MPKLVDIIKGSGKLAKLPANWVRNLDIKNILNLVITADEIQMLVRNVPPRLSQEDYLGALVETGAILGLYEGLKYNLDKGLEIQYTNEVQSNNNS